jgi:glucose-6-phosphate isomerase
MKSVTIRYVPELLSDHENREQFAYAQAAVLRTAFDEARLYEIQKLVAQKKGLQISACVLIGIGGSNLGTMAVQSLLAPDAPIYFIDSLDTDYTYRIYQKIKQLLHGGKHILLNVVSKSGSTTETIADFQLFYTLLSSYEGKRAHEYIVATTDKNSQLWQRAQEDAWTTLEIPADVGGRYSVLTAVGLFPLAMLDLDIVACLRGARTMYDHLTVNPANDAYKSAHWIHAYMRKGYAVHNMFLFGNDMYYLGKWWQQLMGESLGKAVHLDGSAVKQSCIPMVSIGTTDLHAVGQQFLAAVVPVITTFITCKQMDHQLVLQENRAFERLVPHMQHKSLHTIMQAIEQGVMQAYTEKSLPYIHLELYEKNMFAMGQLLQFYMHQVLYLAQLLHVNPFDQPEVELYKRQVRKNLADA